MRAIAFAVPVFDVTGAAATAENGHAGSSTPEAFAIAFLGGDGVVEGVVACAADGVVGLANAAGVDPFPEVGGGAHAGAIFAAAVSEVATKKRLELLEELFAARASCRERRLAPHACRAGDGSRRVAAR